MNRLLAVSCLLSMYYGGANAQDFECMPNRVETNVCDEAEKMRAALVPLLPLVTADGTTLSEVSAVGSIVSVTGTWKMSSKDIRDALQPSLTTIGEFRMKGEESTRKMACSAEPIAAFVGLGGQVRYTYFTSDGDRLLEVLVIHCD